MLPDYPDAKAKLMQILIEQMRQENKRELGFIGEIPRSIMFEGDRSLIKRSDGTNQEIKLETISSEILFTPEEIKTANPDDLFNKMNGAAKEMAKKQKNMVFDTIERESSAIGNVVDGKGRPFSVDMFLEALEKMEIHFDPVTKQPSIPSPVMHPDMVEKAKEELGKIDTDPVYKKRFEEVIEKKRGDWLVRESNRKLVG